MGLLEILILAALALWAVLALSRRRRSGCHGDCAGCAHRCGKAGG